MKEKTQEKRFRKAYYGILIGGIIGILMSFVGISPIHAKENAEPKTMQVVEQINIITPQKVAFEGKDLNLKDTMIKLIGPRGAVYEAVYKDKEKVYQLTKEELTVGVPYTVKADFAEIPKAYETISIPCVLEVKLITPNQIEIIFDTMVDLASATKPENYWIRSSEAKAKAPATLGKEEKVDTSNALKPSEVTIKPKDGTHKVMVMTFKEEVMPKITYSLIPCFINKAGLNGYRGGNFIHASRLDFKYMP